MRKSIAAVVTAGFLSLGAFAPSALAKTAAPSGDVDTKVTHCNKVWPQANRGYVYAYDRTDCKGYVGKSKGDDDKYSNRSNNKATSVLNKGTGRYDTVVFYDGANQSGGEACLKRGEKFADDLRDNKLSNGQTANNQFSSHRWVHDTVACNELT
ncbi:hypothetical protein OG453_33325 [Streptomyces sp. NBC_01381]|uniref:hypothetical protein n=1 Tax=Streptomyces sp. NBC_01381 TaxID=2903845 RepID=UPI00225578AF|nr:hypothetical protein [Streptomyces sp. NBC_01381]MCX4671514.1 hypothetical protein [Streptomyces sp. NBC_01381]